MLAVAAPAEDNDRGGGGWYLRSDLFRQVAEANVAGARERTLCDAISSMRTTPGYVYHILDSPIACPELQSIVF